MKFYHLLFITLLLSCTKLTAQTSMQAMAGHKSFSYNFFWDKDLSDKATFINFTNFDINYKDKKDNSYDIFQMISYKLYKNIGVAVGGSYSGGEFSPQIGLGYNIKKKKHTIQFFSCYFLFAKCQKKLRKYLERVGL